MFKYLILPVKVMLFTGLFKRHSIYLRYKNITGCKVYMRVNMMHVNILNVH